MYIKAQIKTMNPKGGLACEQQIKGWSRKKKEALIRGDWDEIAKLAKKKYLKK